MNVKIEYQFMRQDYIAILRAARRGSRFRFWFLVAMWGGLAINFFVRAADAVAIGGFSFSEFAAHLPDLIPFSILLVVFTFFFEPLLARLRYSSQIMANKIVYMVIDDFGVHEKVGEAEFKIPWSEFSRFIQKPDALFLFLPSMVGYFIPLRAVADAAKLAELGEAIKTNLPDTARR